MSQPKPGVITTYIAAFISQHHWMFEILWQPKPNLHAEGELKVDILIGVECQEEKKLVLLLCWVLQLSEWVPVKSESLLRFSASVVKGHLRDVLVPGMKTFWGFFKKSPSKPFAGCDRAVIYFNNTNFYSVKRATTKSDEQERQTLTVVFQLDESHHLLQRLWFLLTSHFL